MKKIALSLIAALLISIVTVSSSFAGFLIGGYTIVGAGEWDDKCWVRVQDAGSNTYDVFVDPSDESRAKNILATALTAVATGGEVYAVTDDGTGYITHLVLLSAN